MHRLRLLLADLSVLCLVHLCHTGGDRFPRPVLLLLCLLPPIHVLLLLTHWKRQQDQQESTCHSNSQSFSQSIEQTDPSNGWNGVTILVSNIVCLSLKRPNTRDVSPCASIRRLLHRHFCLKEEIVVVVICL